MAAFDKPTHTKRETFKAPFGDLPVFCPICDAPIAELAYRAGVFVDASNPHWGGVCNNCEAEITFDYLKDGILVDAVWWAPGEVIRHLNQAIDDTKGLLDKTDKTSGNNGDVTILTLTAFALAAIFWIGVWAWMN